MFNFLPLIHNLVTIEVTLFIAKHISNHIMKYKQYFTFHASIVLFNIFTNIIHIIQVFNKCFRIFAKI